MDNHSYHFNIDNYNASNKKDQENVTIPTRSCGCLGPCKCKKGNASCQVRSPNSPGPCKINDELNVCPSKLHPNAFWENKQYRKAPAGFGLSSEELKYQLPHPQEPWQPMLNNQKRLAIDLDRKTRLGYPINPSCTCEPMGEQMKKAAAYNKYLWEQPAPIMNYFKPAYPEDDMRPDTRLSLYGYSTPDNRDWLLDPHA